MRQLDLFQKNVTVRPKKVEFKAKYNHLPDYGTPRKLYWTHKLPYLIMTCGCKNEVKIYYDPVKPEPLDVPRWDKWGKLTYNEFQETYATTYCPYCGHKIYIRNAKIKLIEVN